MELGDRSEALPAPWRSIQYGNSTSNLKMPFSEEAKPLRHDFASHSDKVGLLVSGSDVRRNQRHNLQGCVAVDVQDAPARAPRQWPRSARVEPGQRTPERPA